MTISEFQVIQAEYASRGRGRGGGGYKNVRVASFFQGRAMALQNSCARPWLERRAILPCAHGTCVCCGCMGSGQTERGEMRGGEREEETVRWAAGKEGERVRAREKEGVGGR